MQQPLTMGMGCLAHPTPLSCDCSPAPGSSSGNSARLLPPCHPTSISPGLGSIQSREARQAPGAEPGFSCRGTPLHTPPHCQQSLSEHSSSLCAEGSWQLRSCRQLSRGQPLGQALPQPRPSPSPSASHPFPNLLPSMCFPARSAALLALGLSAGCHTHQLPMPLMAPMLQI